MLQWQLVERQRLGFSGLQPPGDLGRGGLEPVDDLDQKLVGLGEAGG
jgi:hypothetical protein